ncbi:hypothetical protein HDK64DRAFT_307237 [Phyllosticta capitalensis]
MGPQSTNTTGAKPPVMSASKSARFSELVSIITSTARALQDEFDFLTPEAWTEILDHMFPGAASLDAPETTTDVAIPASADGKPIPSGMSAEIRTILQNEAAREAAKMEKIGKAPVFGQGAAPRANAHGGQMSEEQRKMEWSLIIRYGDPRASMSDEHFAGLRVAMRRWWNFAPSLEVLKLARKAAEAQFRLVGRFGPGMLPFNTAIWHKATYDGQCKYLDMLIADGDARGVTAMEAFLGKLPAPKAPIQDDVVFVRQTKAAPKTTVKTTQTISKPASQATQTTSKKRSKPEPVHQVDTEDEGPVIKRRKPTTARKAAQKPPVIDLSDTSDTADEKSEAEERPSLIVKLKVAPPAFQSRTIAVAPDAATARPQPVQPAKATQEAPRPKRKYIYKVEAELTENPRTNALISHLVSVFFVKNKKVLANSPWAMEKVRRYALGKEPHIKGPGQTSMLEIGFFEGRDLSWSLTGFQLDRLTTLRKEAKIEWEAKNADSAVDLSHDDSALPGAVPTIEKSPEAHGNVTAQSNTEADASSREDDDKENGDEENSGAEHAEAQDNAPVQSDTIDKPAEDIHMSDSHEDEHIAPQADQTIVSAEVASNDEATSATIKREDEDVKIQTEDVDMHTQDVDMYTQDVDRTQDVDMHTQEVDMQPANKVSTPAPEEDIFTLFTTLNDSPSSAAEEDAAAANQLLAEQHQQYMRSTPEHTAWHADSTPATATAADPQDTQLQITGSAVASQASSSPLGSRSTTPHESNHSNIGAATSSQHLTYSQTNADNGNDDSSDDSSDDEAEFHDAVSTTEEM